MVGRRWYGCPKREAQHVALPYWISLLLIRSRLARFVPAAQRATDGGAAFLRYCSDRVLCAPVNELRCASEFLEVHGPDSIDLALGSPRFDIVPSAATKLPADQRGWPPAWGLAALREAVAAKLQEERQLAIQATDGVLISHGAAGAFSVALDAFVQKRDRVVLFDPTSPLFSFFLTARQARVRWVPTWLERGETRFRLELLAKLLRGARLLVLSTPCNPTGAASAAEDLEQIAWWARRRDVLILNDESFEGFHYERRSPSIGAFASAQQRTLTIGSVSKTYALSSARVGWLAGHRHLVRPCMLAASLHSPFVPTVCQQIAGAALNQDGFEATRRDFAARREYVFERLQGAGLSIEMPASGFFFWIPVRELGTDGHEFASQLLRARRVLVTPGNVFGPSGAGHIRLSFAQEDGRLREGLTRLLDFVREIRPKSMARAA
jgi:aspartate/methionine/tyrosine aminotransferase